MVSLLFCSANYEQQPSDLLAPRNAKRHGWRCNQAASLHRERHMGIVAQRAEHLRRSHKAVRHKVRVGVRPRRRTRWGDANRACPHGPRRIEDDNRAISGAHETVRHKVRIQVSSRRGATRIRARGNCPLKGPSPGLRYVKCGKGAI